MKVAMITQYPAPTIKYEDLSGVASFCKYQYENFDDLEIDFIIYANKFSTEPLECKEAKITVNYCWEKGNNPFGAIFKDIKNRKVDIVHVQHELFLFGGAFSNLFLWFFLMKCKLKGIKTIIEPHGVVPLDKLNKDFTKDNRINIPPVIAKIIFFVFYKFLDFAADRFFVHEQLFKTYLNRFYHIKSQKIDVVNLCVKKEKLFEKEKARKILKIDHEAKVVLYFGFITGYKGLDYLVESAPAFLNKLEKGFLFVSGGLHPRLKNDPDYLSYIEKLKSNLLNTKGGEVRWNGFAEDSDIPIMYAAADVVVFPYTVGISSSGPLALAIAHERPFLVSHAFDGIIDMEDCFFNNEPEDIAKMICRFFNQPDLRKKIQEYSFNLKTDRQPDTLLKKIVQVYKNLI